MTRHRVRRPTRSALKRRPRLERLEERLTMAERVWDGGAIFGDNWTDFRNWEGNVAPVAGDELVFPGGVGSLDRTTNNDFPANTQFEQIRFTGEGYTLSGNSVRLGPGIVASEIEDGGGSNTINMNIQIVNPNGFISVDLGETVQLNGQLSGAGGLLKVGEGRVILGGSSPNTYQGATRVRGGSLQLQKTAGVTAVPTALTISEENIFSTNPNKPLVTVINNEQIANGIPIVVRQGSRLSISGTETIGQLTLNDARVSGPGTLVLGLNSTVDVVNGEDAASFIEVANLTLANGTRTVTVNESGATTDLTISSRITGTSGLTKNGPGSLRMIGAANTYTGTTRVNEGFVFLGKDGLAINGPLIVGASSGPSAEVRMSTDQLADSIAVTVNRQGLLAFFSDPRVAIQSLTLQGGEVALFSGSLTVTGSITTLASDQTSKISSLGAPTIAPLSLGISFAPFPPATPIVVADGPASVDLEITSPFAGVKGFRKQGEGSLVLVRGGSTNFGDSFVEAGVVNTRGDRSLTPKVTVTGGKLLVDGENDLTDVIVSGGQFGGSGLVKSLTVNGGTVSPSDEFGPTSTDLRVLNNMTLAVGTTLAIDLNGDAAANRDQLTIGQLVLANPAGGQFPTLDLRVGAGFDPPVGTQFTILKHNLGTQTVGIFRDTAGNPLPEGAGFVASGKNFVISYLGGTPENREIVVTRDTAPAFANRSLTAVASEGGLVTLAGTITEPDAGDSFKLVVNWGDNTPVETFTFPPGSNGQRVAVTHRYADNGRFNVSFTWSDPHGGAKSDKLRVVVTNVAPQLLDLALSEPRLAGRPVTLTGRIADPGHDSFTLRVIWGDGSVENRQFPAGTQQFSLTHTYQRNARFQINLVLLDDDGGVDTEQLKLQIGSQSPSAAAIDAVLAAGLDFTTIRARRR